MTSFYLFLKLPLTLHLYIFTLSLDALASSLIIIRMYYWVLSWRTTLHSLTLIFRKIIEQISVAEPFILLHSLGYQAICGEWIFLGDQGWLKITFATAKFFWSDVFCKLAEVQFKFTRLLFEARWNDLAILHGLKLFPSCHLILQILPKLLNQEFLLLQFFVILFEYQFCLI